jgi:hypothetical protein
MVAAAAIALQRARAAEAKRRQKRDIEGPLQVSIVQYARAVLPHGWIVKHTANKPRSKFQGAREKRMGAKAGWPDVDIIGPADFPPCLWLLEVKPEHGRLSEEQAACHDQLKDLGHNVRVVRSIDDVRRAFRDWNLPTCDVRVPEQAGRAA